MKTKTYLSDKQEAAVNAKRPPLNQQQRDFIKNELMDIHGMSETEAEDAIENFSTRREVPAAVIKLAQHVLSDPLLNGAIEGLSSTTGGRELFSPVENRALDHE